MIYLDHAASTVPYPQALQKSQDASAHLIANPISNHTAGQTARKAIDDARLQVAGVFGVKPAHVVFTSGATEATHMATIGAFLHAKKQDPNSLTILRSPFLHHSGINATQFCADHLGATLLNLPIDPNGHFDTTTVAHATPGLIVTEHASSETGILQKITALRAAFPHTPIVLDIAASIVTEYIDFSTNPADFLCLSAEKIGGLKGSGALIMKHSTSHMLPLIAGTQEWGLRGGTENLSGIVALGEALSVHHQNKSSFKSHLQLLHDTTRDFFAEYLPDCIITTPTSDFIEDIFHFILPDSAPDGATFVVQCDMQGLCISAGPACASGAVGGSKVLLSKGYTPSQAKRGVRISFGRTTTVAELNTALHIIQKNI